MTKQKTTEEFIEQLDLIVDPGTELVGEYLGAKTKVFLKCENGHLRSVYPSNLLSRGNSKTCPVCIPRNTTRLTLLEANERLQAKHPDLCMLDYFGSETPTTIYSNICGHSWEATPHSIITNGAGSICRLCTPAQNVKLTLEEANTRIGLINKDIFIKEYINSTLPVTVYSKICSHTWESTLQSIYSKDCGYTCRICNPRKSTKLILEDVNNRIKEKYSDLYILEYSTAISKTNIYSDKCGHSWLGQVSNLLYKDAGYTCPVCKPYGTSIEEKELVEFIKSIYSGWIIENDRVNISPQELDIVLPDLGIAFEYNGVYYHSETFKDKHYHLDKTVALRDTMDYQLIHINSDEWLLKQDIVKSRISAILGKSNKIYARKCVLKEIAFPKEFLVINHIQGAGAFSSINLGLYYNDILVAVMTFATPKFTKTYTYELVRYCSLLNHTVVGGASKLLKYFRKKYTGSIVSYSDKRWSTGNLYKTLGFQYSHTSDPNYKYYKGTTSLSRYQCQKHKLEKLIPNTFDVTLSESENMTKAGYYRVYDCGNDVWTMPAQSF